MDQIKDAIPDYQYGDFLCPKSGTKLASLFGMEHAESQGDESFQFTAPKQPKKISTIVGPPPHNPSSPLCAPAVLFATAAHAFCLVNEQYVKQGKIGAAVLGNHVTREYKILLYGRKQKQITTATIHRGFVLTVQPCNYVTFYDDQQQNWSLTFDSEKARPEFCKEVCVARWNCETSSDSLVTQDLAQGEGQAVETGDTVRVAYTGWHLKNHSLGQLFDSNLGKEKLQRVKLGAGKAMRGWEDGMLGMQKGGRRLLIVPASMASKAVPNNVPANSTLVFDVEIHRVKFCKGRHSGGSVNTCRTSPDACHEENIGQLVTTDTKKDQAPKGTVEATPAASKAKLISRIAKMGQPMLAFLAGAVPAQPDPSDSETEEVNESEHSCDPSCLPTPKPAQMPCSSAALSCRPDDAQKQEAMPLQVESTTTQGFQSYSSEHNPYIPSHPKSFASIQSSQHIQHQTPDITSFLMCEARQLNAEILLAIEKVTHRVDQLTCKVDEMQKVGGFSIGLSSVNLETKMILNSIQRIIQIPSSGELNRSFTQAYEQPQEVLHVQQRATEIQADLSAALEDKHEHCTQISLLEAPVEELVNQGEQSKQWHVCKEMETNIQNLDEKQDLRAGKEHLEQMKRVMDGVCRSLQTQFDPQESYSGHTVLGIIQNTLKNITVKHMSECWEVKSDMEEELQSTEDESKEDLYDNRSD